MKKPAKTLASPRPWYRQSKLYLIMVCIVIASTVISAFVYRQHRIRTEKAQFAEAQAEINSLTAAIMNKLGPPLKITRDDYCSRPNVEVGKGPLSCHETELLYFGYRSMPEANNAVISIHTQTPDNKTKSVLISKSSNRDLISSQNGPLSHYYTVDNGWPFGTGSIICNNSSYLYEAMTPPFQNMVAFNDYQYVAAVNMDCSGLAERAYFNIQ